jgi:hypothetical protein
VLVEHRRTLLYVLARAVLATWSDSALLIVRCCCYCLVCARVDQQLISTLLRYGGSAARTGDLFGNKNWMASFKSTITRGMQGAVNVYTQHKPLLRELIDKAIKGKLLDAEYPILHGAKVCVESMHHGALQRVWLVMLIVVEMYHGRNDRLRISLCSSLVA